MKLDAPAPTFLGMSFGSYLTELRTARKIAKNNLAKRLGVPFSTVNHWELHGASPNQANMRKLIDELKLTPSEKTKLTELWLAIPRGEGEAGEVVPPASTRPTGEAETALEALLTRSIVPGRHTMFDALGVFRVLSEAAPLVAELALEEAAARAWLDAAASLRERGVKVSAATLLAIIVGPPKK